MKFPNQLHVLEKLERESVKEIDGMRRDYLKQLFYMWGATRRDLKRIVWQAYKDVVPNGIWDYGTAKRSGALIRIQHETKASIELFKRHSTLLVSKSLNDLYKESILRQAWMLDQLTPPSYTIHLPKKQRVMESGRVTVTSGEDALAKWRARWEGWLDSYHSSLNHNINSAAIGDLAVDDVVDKVDTTRANSPSYDIWAALQRVYMDITQVSIAMGQSDVAESNEDVGEKTIWQTRYNQRVCEICDDNAGKEESETDGDIPAHPNCACYWRVVPKEWADLLASGDESEREAAIRLDATGQLPTSMVIMGADGNPRGHLIVNFNDWADESGMAA
jgi:hypothetical protein